jgi:hypothetical protein
MFCQAINELLKSVRQIRQTIRRFFQECKPYSKTCAYRNTDFDGNFDDATNSEGLYDSGFMKVFNEATITKNGAYFHCGKVSANILFLIYCFQSG